ncbi:hypothetical protein EGI22_04800 [Lacihabitans sp. LS3-19]|uniref:hypothetical protein n=1 Tax=Lacihabitans sp. LS3-19 TaxID=2487335 RepID=UPI0020CCE008|nr:hypothetical protein [Lacihabitans sp. LS3-19]MCP9767218.1 hypothetical protein [Lacihabitans sp. LS3-19]
MNEEEKLEKFIGKIMTNSKLEAPSIDFTSKIMMEVNAKVLVKKKAYVPIFSKLQLVSVSFITCVFILYAFYSDAKNGFSNQLLSNNIFNKLFSNIYSIQYSMPAIYATIIFSTAFFVQVIWLKKRFRIN